MNTITMEKKWSGENRTNWTGGDSPELDDDINEVCWWQKSSLIVHVGFSSLSHSPLFPFLTAFSFAFSTIDVSYCCRNLLLTTYDQSKSHKLVFIRFGQLRFRPRFPNFTNIFCEPYNYDVKIAKHKFYDALCMMYCMCVCVHASFVLLALIAFYSRYV